MCEYKLFFSIFRGVSDLASTEDRDLAWSTRKVRAFAGLFLALCFSIYFADERPSVVM